MVSLIMLLAAALAAASILAVRLRSSEKSRASLEEEVSALAKYRAIPDAMVYADRIRGEAHRNAQEIAAEARQEAERLLGMASAQKQTADTVAQEIRARAEYEAAAVRQSADALVGQATAEAARIRDKALSRADEIAGEAMVAMRDAKRLEQTVRSLKNLIEGYGDKYVMPTYGLLDELASELGFTEAGKKLKEAREKTRAMISARAAATCDYVEESRRQTAINFVLDAFNGKVDAILARVKDDNFGTLGQRIRDAFVLVNHNGQAFRNARVTEECLDARMEELRWAVVAQELKAKEREEQRQLKERIREEERTQREYEQAIKEAEKEEQIIRKTLEKAKKDLERASEAQKAVYEEQIRQLGERLQAAEENSQRAISMAQQTKAGTVYIISNIGSFGENVFKIGLTRRLEPLERVRELGDASVPFEFDVHALIPCDDAPALEHELHRRFVRMQVNKVNARKEFFRVSIGQIRDEIERMGHSVTWTLTTDCREYRESLAIERAMASRTFEETSWIEKQVVEHDASMREGNVSSVVV